MKPFMNTCYKCKSPVKTATCVKENIKLECMRCTSCKEEYFTSSQLLKFDILTGRKAMVRKFGTLGNSTIMRLPPKILEDYNIKPGDYALFEERPEGIFVKLVHAKEIEG